MRAHEFDEIFFVQVHLIIPDDDDCAAVLAYGKAGLRPPMRFAHGSLRLGHRWRGWAALPTAARGS